MSWPALDNAEPRGIDLHRLVPGVFKPWVDTPYSQADLDAAGSGSGAPAFGGVNGVEIGQSWPRDKADVVSTLVLGDWAPGVKVLDQGFDTDLAGISAPPSEWGIGDLTDWSISGGEAMLLATTSERGLYLPGPFLNTLQIATVRVGSVANSNNRFRLKSHMVPGEQTGIDGNFIAQNAASNFRCFVYDDAAANQASSTTLGLTQGDYVALWMLTFQEMVMIGATILDATDKDIRGEYVGPWTGTPSGIVGVSDAHANWPAELQKPHTGGGLMLSMAGAQNTGATPSSIARWEVWDLGN